MLQAKLFFLSTKKNQFFPVSEKLSQQGISLPSSPDITYETIKYICNVIKCRPPNNRDPKTDEVDACRKYLKRQLELIKPKIILALGRIAAQNLLKLDIPIGKMRGNSYLYPNSNLPVVVTYHPAYLLRSPREKRKVWGDLKFAMQKYKELT